MLSAYRRADDAAVFAVLMSVVGRHLKPRHKSDAKDLLARMARGDD